MRLVVITGLSGAGKTLAIRYMEDLGFFCIDNLPPKLMPKFAELCYQSWGEKGKAAVVVDIRGGGFFDDLLECLQMLRDDGFTYEILFLDAQDDALIKRYKESRRMHPLVKEGRLIQGINIERERLKKVQEKATYIIDTTHMQPKQIKEILSEMFGESDLKSNISISVISFGFRRGILLDADLVFDVRFLPNPFYIDDLKDFSGEHIDVKNYIFSFSETKDFLDRLVDLLEFLVPYYTREGKFQLVVGIGCTGGRHRSVAIANALFELLKLQGHKVTVEHRDISETRN